MPKLRINLRDLSAIDDLDLADEVAELEEREARDERAQQGRERRPINPIALQRRQEGRKFGQDIARVLRERKSPKP